MQIKLSKNQTGMHNKQQNNMIVREFYKTRKDGVNLYRTYSDSNMYIRQIETGVEYSEAIDVEDAPYTYEEMCTPIEYIKEDPIITDVESTVIE